MSTSDYHYRRPSRDPNTDRKPGDRQFTLRTLLLAPLALAVLLSAATYLGYGVVCGAIASILVICLRRSVARGVAGEPPYVGSITAPMLPNKMASCASGGKKDERWTRTIQYLTQPLDASWLWGVWVGWAAGWWFWRSHEGPTRDLLCNTAVWPVWFVCAILILRHRYVAIHRVEPPLRAFWHSLGLAFQEILALYMITLALCLFIHFP